MASHGRVRRKSIYAMLEACAPGYTVKEGVHRDRILWREHEYHLPKGEHGKRNDPSIQIGHVRALVRAFGISSCAQQHLPQLR